MIMWTAYEVVVARFSPCMETRKPSVKSMLAQRSRFFTDSQEQPRELLLATITSGRDKLLSAVTECHLRSRRHSVEVQSKTSRHITRLTYNRLAGRLGNHSSLRAEDTAQRPGVLCKHFQPGTDRSGGNFGQSTKRSDSWTCMDTSKKEMS